MAVAAAGIGAWAAANAGTIAAVSAAASVAAASYSTYSQIQQGKAESAAAELQNKEAAKQAAAAYDDLTPAEIDANKQANDQALQQQAEALQAKGRVNLFAAASGTLGGSVDSMLYDIDVQKSKNINTILTQRESGLYSIKQQAEQIRQGGLSNQTRQPINQPSWLEGGLKIGAQVVKGFDQYGRMNKETFQYQKPATSANTIKGGV